MSILYRYYFPAGLLKTYHAKNEYCLFSDMAQGFQVFVSIISQLEEEA
jgi:acetylornithine deacetylase